ncbi:MAG: geranylgeranylglycerol-phosphate geranylgeranyltransferase [Phaeodactylibacter sp.]|nr:geranylgeranylglycerol-phosphate geranylgeranyltransferase [Phaeodactylibacter sp.]MCB9273332.1 geranylgeranylglycerol-phosphate geranylgeranyltransferase [Lewinellaceae bacterium]
MILALFRLIRLPNLVIVALTQYLVYYILLIPAFRQAGIAPALDGLHFNLLVITTVLITAGGNIFNDIVDFRIDLANRPEKVVINRKIRKETAYWLYFCINLLGFVTALYLAFYVNKVYLANLFPLAVSMLFLYSTHFKRLPFVGNFLIALFCAGVAGIIWFAEREGFETLRGVAPEKAAQAGLAITWYMVFAFMSTMFREIIKDMEDLQGDLGANCRTIPALWGIGVGKASAAFFGLGLLAFLIYLPFRQPEWFTRPSLYYLFFVIALPLSIALVLLIRSNGKKAFYNLSQLAKLIMLSGLAMLLLLALK